MARRKEAQSDFDLFASNVPSKHRKHIPAPAAAQAVGPSGPAMMGGPSGPAMMGGPSGPAMMGGPSGPAMMGGPSGPARSGAKSSATKKAKAVAAARPKYRYMDDETYRSLF